MAMRFRCDSSILIKIFFEQFKIGKKLPFIYLYHNYEKYISSETEGPGAYFMTRTLQLRSREFGEPIIYMIPVPLLT